MHRIDPKPRPWPSMFLRLSVLIKRNNLLTRDCSSSGAQTIQVNIPVSVAVFNLHSSQLSATTYITCLTTFIVSYAAAQVLTTVTSNYRMLEDPQYSEVVRWGDQGDSFVVLEVGSPLPCCLTHIQHFTYGSIMLYPSSCIRDDNNSGLPG